jgi:hypothetical protein
MWIAIGVVALLFLFAGKATAKPGAASPPPPSPPPSTPSAPTTPSGLIPDSRPWVDVATAAGVKRTFEPVMNVTDLPAGVTVVKLTADGNVCLRFDFDLTQQWYDSDGYAFGVLISPLDPGYVQST